MSSDRIYGKLLLVCLFVAWTNKHFCHGDVVDRSEPTVSNNSMIDDLLDQVFVTYQGERSNVFDWNLFKVLSDKHEGNILISPISLKLALILLYEGSQGQTATELTNAMQLSVNRSVIRDKFSNILQSFKAIHPKYELNIGTRLYIDKIITVRQQYEAIVKNFYDVDVISANLSDTHDITDNINAWVKNVTSGSIDKMIEDENNLEGTLMMVLNTIFFKGTWENHIFSPNDTRSGNFYLDLENTVKVPYMNTAGRFYVSELPQFDAKILRLPYQGDKYAMYIVLPGVADGLNQLIEKIDQFAVTKDKSVMQDLTVDVSIPKFKFHFTGHLKPALEKLGIESLFSDTATLTGIGTTKRSSPHLRVSEVIQKNGIEMNEVGTVAYAATEILVANKIEGESFRVKHPFLFYIEDETSGTILYIGKVMNPLEENGHWNEL